MYNLENNLTSPSKVDFLLLYVSVASSKFFYANFIAFNKMASYFLHALTSMIFAANLTLLLAIYLTKVSFLLAKPLYSSYNLDL